jgi:ClpP class serine protease
MGEDALAAGLVDEIGTLEDAIAEARRRAGSFRTAWPKTPLRAIMEPNGANLLKSLKIDG